MLERLKTLLLSTEDFREIEFDSEDFRELLALRGVAQNPKYHPEGDAFTHTILVMNQAARLRTQARCPFAFMLVALCHDYGKAVCTAEKDGKIVSYGHEKRGLPPGPELHGSLWPGLGDEPAGAEPCGVPHAPQRPVPAKLIGKSHKTAV